MLDKNIFLLKCGLSKEEFDLLKIGWERLKKIYAQIITV